MTASWYERGYSVGRRWRWTVILATIAFFVGALSTFYWHQEVFRFLLAPADGKLSPFDGKPVVNAPTAMFGATLSLAITGGKLAALPFIVVGFLSLIKPLTPFDWWRRFIAINTAIAFVLFATGVAFVYFVMMPVSLNFLLSFGSDIAVPVILLDEYMELLTSLFKWIGFVFLLPLIMNMLARLRLLSYRRAKGVWRVGIFLVLFFSAIISPGLDGTLTIFVAVPMYLLYLVGLGAVWAVHPEEGNYLWLGTICRWLRKVRNGIAWALRKVRGGIAWVVRWPVRGIRWVYRKARHVLWGHWLGE